MENPWAYPPLTSDRSIRLLRLAEGTGDDEIVCYVATIELDDPARYTYEALSYAWGNPEPGEAINFNGLPGKLITPNLAAALRGFRFPDLAIILWIDALCINQDDLDERAQQVSIMADIYLGAKHTIVWLGNDRANTSDGLDILRRAALEVKKITTVKDGIEAVHIDKQDFSLERNTACGFPPPEDKKWDPLKWIISRPWFTRVWVIQEFGLSVQPMFLLERQQIHWVDFTHGIIWLLNRGYWETILPKEILGPAIFVLMCRPDMESVSRDKRHPLLKVLDDARSLHATDRRDKVFALLAVSNEGSKKPICPLLAPDYRKTVKEVLMDSTRHFLECSHDDDDIPHGNLDVLEHVIHMNKYKLNSEYPSWCPRWDLTTVSNEFEEMHRASGTIPSRFKTPFTTREIVPGGFTLGIITATPNDLSRLYLDSPLQWEERKIWLATKNLWMKYARHLKGYENREERALVFAKTLSAAGNMSSKDGRPTLADFVVYCRERIVEDERLKELETAITTEKDQGSATSSSQDNDLLEPFDFPEISPDLEAQGGSRYMRDGIARRTFIIVDGLRMGLGPHSACVGDIVCLLYGGKTPFVLRREENEDGGYYTLVGACYIHGLMNGEALLEKERRSLEDEWFVIR